MRLFRRKAFPVATLVLVSVGLMFSVPGAHAVHPNIMQGHGANVLLNGRRYPNVHHPMDILRDFDRSEVFDLWDIFRSWDLDNWNPFADPDPDTRLVAHMARTLCKMMHENKRSAKEGEHTQDYIIDEGYSSDGQDYTDPYPEEQFQNDFGCGSCSKHHVQQKQDKTLQDKSHKLANNDDQNMQPHEGMNQWRRAAKEINNQKQKNKLLPGALNDWEYDNEEWLAKLENQLRQEKKDKLLERQRAEEAVMQKRKEELERQRMQSRRKQNNQDHNKQKRYQNRNSGGRTEMHEGRCKDEGQFRPQGSHQEERYPENQMDESHSLHPSAGTFHDFRNPEKVSISLDVPGYHPDNIHIRTEGNHIKVSGKQACGCDDGCLIREFEKSYDLPEGTDIKSLRVLHSGGKISINGLQYGIPMTVKDTTIPVESFDQHLPPKNAHFHCKRNKPGIQISKIDKRTGKTYVPEEHEEENGPLNRNVADDDVTIEVVEEHL